MGRKRYSAEQIINHLRQAEILLAQGKTVGNAARELGISEQTYYRWRKEYGGMDIGQAHRLKELEKENQRLKRIIADQALDISILKEVSRGNFFHEKAIHVKADVAAVGLWACASGQRPVHMSTACRPDQSIDPPYFHPHS
jgi:transposase-like protein